MTVASVDDYRGDGREAELDADQPPLDFAAGGEDFEAPPADDSDLAGEDATEMFRTGDRVTLDKHGDVEVSINVKTGMVEGTPVDGSALALVDIRAATVAELAAERERTADFGA